MEDEIFEKLNDYTLSVVFDFDRLEDSEPELRRIFNFKARQITTIYSTWCGDAVSNVMHIQNFSDLDSLDEVKLMHETLIEEGGEPPPLEDILSQYTKPRFGKPGGI